MNAGSPPLRSRTSATPRSSSHLIAIGLAVLLATGPAASQAPDIALRPAPQNLTPEPPRNLGPTPYDPALDWGVGLLEPAPTADYIAHLARGGHQLLVEELGEHIDWIARLDLPLFEAPSGRQWGWLTEGRVVDLDTGGEYAIRADARLRVSYDLDIEALFVLREQRDDGWLQIRWAGSEAPHGGRAWTHPGFHSDPQIDAEFHSWEAAFRSPRSRFAYRDSNAVHLMRAGPSRDDEIVHRIEGRDWDMEILEMQGDWIRVRLSWPSECNGQPPAGEIEGWTVWRSPAQGPWLYSPIGGC
jgi:hypothetical protein